MEDKRKRTVNFTSDEKSVLTDLVIKYKDIIENKKSDATTNAEKANGWKRLSEEFNALSTHCRRAPESLKTCWENIKRQTKKQSASRKREIFMTGGGRPPPPPPSTGADRMKEAILGPALEILENPYDGDAILDSDGKEIGAPSTTDHDYIHMGSDIEFLNSENEGVQTVEVGSEPLSSFTQSPIAGTSSENNTSWNKENNFKWESWTPKSLRIPISEVLNSQEKAEKAKRPISEVLNTQEKAEKASSWLKRRRPNQQSLSDQLMQEKINLLKILIESSKEESKRRILILDEQLKQEKIKTQKLL